MISRLSLAVSFGLLASVGTAKAATKSREAASHARIVRDWMLQDYMSIALPARLEKEKEHWRQQYLNARESRPDPPVLERLPCFVSKDDSVVEQRMLDRVLGELRDAGGPFRAELERLKLGTVPGRDRRWKDLYVRACEQRRARRLGPLVARWTRFVFSQHRHIPGTWKYTEGLSDAQSYRFFAPGSSLEILELGGPYGQVRTILEDRDGMLRNPDVSHDGKHLLFAWKKSNRKDDYHLFEMELATGATRQLTHGLGLADYEGIYLDDQNICFSSTRCIQTVDCNYTEVSNLYLMDRRGRFMRRVGFDQVHTIFPTATDDGRVLYTRWDYNDRGQIYTQPLFEMNFDGSGQKSVYGDVSWFPTNLIHARQIPGTQKLVAIVTGHHRPAHGKLALIDLARGRQEEDGVRLIAPVRTTEPIRVDRYGVGGNQFQYPYPLDEDRFLVTLSLPTPEGKLGRFNIYLVDIDGSRELLVEGKEAGEGIGCKQVVPLAPREQHRLRPNTVDYRKETGRLYMQDIYAGEALKGISRGTVKKLRVVELRFRAAGIGHLRHTGKGGAADVSTPIAVGTGSWDVKAVLGSATVYEDGSAFFTVPARTPVYFQALDARNHVVQTMRSWTTLMPGETQSCVGCHEQKNTAPLAQRENSLALQAGTQKLVPFYGPTRGFSYPREIQPILDEHCVRCHAGDKKDDIDLTARAVDNTEMKRRLSASYLALTHTRGVVGDHTHPLVNWINCMSEPEMLPPYHRGAATSALMTMLEDGHEEVMLSAEELEKIACWIDLLVPYCGDYTEANLWTPDERELYARFSAKRALQEERERANIQALIETQTGTSAVLSGRAHSAE